ncbi:MAG TPA: DUF58 domain-containing protein [Acidimicrobiales bacterium]|nr:DUF58 domain-containing protein [Acidimicrobiales bacterium]
MAEGAHFASGNGDAGPATIVPEIADDLDAGTPASATAGSGEAVAAAGTATPGRPGARRSGRRRRDRPARRLVLTPVGRAVLGGTVVAYAAGWGLGYTELLVVAAAGLLAAVLALLWTWPRSRVAVERTISPERVVRGEPAEARLSVANLTRRRLPALRLRDRVGARYVDVMLPRAAPGATGQTSYELPTERRGIVEVGPLAVIRRDPFGLTRSARRHGSTETLWVYPRIHQVAPLASGRRRDLEGPTHDNASGNITFHALREYVTGDDLRLIHWRSTARTGTLMVRQQADPSQPHVTIVLDTHTGSFDDDAFEAAVEAAASLVVASTSRRFPVRLLTGDALLASGRSGRGTASALLDHLTPLERSDTATLGAAATRLSAERGGQSLVVLTGTPAPDALAAVTAVGRRYPAMAVVRFDSTAEPGIAWDRGILDAVAPTAESFAALWNGRV